MIKQREVEVILTNVSTQRDEQIKFVVIPLNPMVDLTLRHYEPEHSFFELKIPPFMELTDKGYSVRASKANARAELDRGSNSIRVTSKTSDAMSVNSLQLYLYKDQYYADLISTIRLDVKALPCIYRQMKAGMQSTIALSFPVDTAPQV